MKEVDQEAIERSSNLNAYSAAGYRFNISRAYGSSTTRSQKLRKSIMLTHTGIYTFDNIPIYLHNKSRQGASKET